MKSKRLLLVLALAVVAGLALVGCGEPELGSQDNPIVWAFVPSGETDQVTTGAEELSALLTDETGLYFDVLVTTEYAGAVEAMCSDPAEAQMSSLNTFSYVLANERCGVEAELVAVRFGSPTYNGQIITQADSDIQGVEDLAGKTFCRPDPLSTSGWIIPSLTMRANGIDPVDYLRAQSDLELQLQELNEMISAPLAVDFGEKAGGCCQD